MSALKYNVGDIVIFYNSGFLNNIDWYDDSCRKSVQLIGDHKLVKIIGVDDEDAYYQYFVEYCEGNNVYMGRWVPEEYLMDVTCFGDSFDDSEEIIL